MALPCYEDLALLQAALVYFSREAASSFSRGGASDLEAACFAAAREGLFFLCRQQWLQSKQYSCQASVAHSAPRLKGLHVWSFVCFGRLGESKCKGQSHVSQAS